MPNEKIYRSVPTFEVVGPPGGPFETVEGGSRTEMVEVAWYPDQNVQIGIDLGREFHFTDDEVDRTPVASLWMDLSRHEINRLIKALRRARDAAYGRDE